MTKPLRQIMEDEFDLPEPPTTNLPSVKESFTGEKEGELPEERYYGEEGKISETKDLVSTGSQLQLVEDDFKDYELDQLEKKIAATELADCDLYLKNLHTGFKHVNSINSLIKIVGAGIQVHKHRRSVMEKLKNGIGSSKGGYTFDENGNLVAKKV